MVDFVNEILKNSKLFELNISENSIGNEGLDVLSECITTSSLNYLRKLNLTECKITYEGIENLFYKLQNNKKLENLNLSKNNLSSDKFIQLRNCLSIINLKEIRMAKCKIGNEGAIAIADSACNNNSIELLDLSENKIDDKGFSAFINVPIKNYSLEVLDVSKNLISVNMQNYFKFLGCKLQRIRKKSEKQSFIQDSQFF